jgi:hypothetical protein
VTLLPEILGEAAVGRTAIFSPQISTEFHFHQINVENVALALKTM